MVSRGLVTIYISEWRAKKAAAGVVKWGPVTFLQQWTKDAAAGARARCRGGEGRRGARADSLARRSPHTIGCPVAYPRADRPRGAAAPKAKTKGQEDESCTPEDRAAAVAPSGASPALLKVC